MLLEIKTALPIMRQAFDNKELQMFRVHDRHNRGCYYNGPCAIGVCLPQDLREKLDENGVLSFTSVVLNNDITVVNDEEKYDLAAIQRAHDNAVLESCNGE